ncbi:MAG: hypothetical protein QG608_857 [Actinomycetota bacterium]|nr:hypothetical protein [Actinomycetota bacterium]
MDRSVNGPAGSVPPARTAADRGTVPCPACPACEEPPGDGDVFCEGCGTPLAASDRPAADRPAADRPASEPAPPPVVPPRTPDPDRAASPAATPPPEPVPEQNREPDGAPNRDPSGESSGEAGPRPTPEPLPEPVPEALPEPAPAPETSTETAPAPEPVPESEPGPESDDPMNSDVEDTTSGSATPDSVGSGERAAGNPDPGSTGDRTHRKPSGEKPGEKPSTPAPLWRDITLDGLSDTCGKCSGAISPEGTCALCGAPASPPRDHWEERPSSWVAGVSDRGLRHSHNEDAMAVAATEEAGRWGVLVVSDGVSSAAGSDVASLAAARAAREVLVLPLPDEMEARAGQPLEAGGQLENEEDEILLDRMTQAGRAAQNAAAGAALTVGTPPGVNPPSCTMVAALLRFRTLVIGWIGDSRIYWVPDDDEPVQLSADDSWIWEQVALGASLEDAERSPWAHAITRWLGRDSPDPMLRTALVELPGPGWVLVCSDGLWNYASHPQRIAEVLRQAESAAAGDPEVIASGMVEWAVKSGGHDNITVTLARA